MQGQVRVSLENRKSNQELRGAGFVVSKAWGALWFLQEDVTDSFE